MMPRLAPRRYRHAGVALALLVLLAGVPIVQALAARDFRDDILVGIIRPVTTGNTHSVTAYTPGRQVPAQIPVGVTSQVLRLNNVFDNVPPVDTVRAVLGGTVNEATNQITGERQSVTATRLSGTPTSQVQSMLAVVNAALLDFTEVQPRGTLPALFASDFIRTVAIVDAYYSSARTVSDIAAVAEIGIDVSLRDLAEIDADGNLIPDASALLQAPLNIVGPNGEMVFVVSLGDPVLRGGTFDDFFATYFDTPLGPLRIDAVFPNLSTIQSLAGGTLDAFDTARLFVAIGASASGLLDGPDGVDPLSEFALDTPAPQNIFASVNLALATTGPTVRGTIIPEWTFLDALPNGAQFELSLSGPAIAQLLSDGVEVAGYTYDVTMAQEQSGENIFVDGDESGWAEVADVVLFDNDNADDNEGARSVIAADGDDGISIEGQNVSAIYASNIAPSLTAGGGSSDSCFIATAAFGTPMAQQLDSLRGVRDGYLLTNPLGAIFADAYYRLSPPVAGQIAQNEPAQSAVRSALWPVIAASRWLLSSPATAAAALLTLTGLTGIALRRRA